MTMPDEPVALDTPQPSIGSVEIPQDPSADTQEPDFHQAIAEALAQPEQPPLPIFDPEVTATAPEVDDAPPPLEDGPVRGTSAAGDTIEDEEPLDATAPAAMSEQELSELLAIRDWMSSLSPEQLQGAMLGTLNPAAFSQPEPATTPAAPTPAAPDPLDSFAEFVDPEIVNYLRAERDQRQALEAQLAVYQQSQEANRQMANRAAVDSVLATTQTQYGLTEEQVDDLVRTAAQSGLGPLYDQQYADPTQRYTALFDHILWSDPNFRADQIARSHATQQADDDAIRAANRERKARASGVTSSSGSLPRQAAPVDPRSLSHQDRLRLMEQEIADARTAGVN